jgi:hypothetical protein
MVGVSMPTIEEENERLSAVYGLKETMDYWFMAQEEHLTSEIAQKFSGSTDATKPAVATALILLAACNVYPLSKSLLTQIASDLDKKSLKIYISAMINQLRFPNEYTKYFSTTILDIFSKTKTEYVSELILSLLVERLVICEPHPWGVIVTFLELMRNPAYGLRE